MLVTLLRTFMLVHAEKILTGLISQKGLKSQFSNRNFRTFEHFESEIKFQTPNFIFNSATIVLIYFRWISHGRK